MGQAIFQTHIYPDTPGICAVVEYTCPPGEPLAICDALRDAAREILHDRYIDGWEMPYPYNWGDIFEELYEHRDDTALAERHHVRVIEILQPIDVLNHDEVVLDECDIQD